MKLCSACLLGVRCRYDGQVKPNALVKKLAISEPHIPICPEQLGGQMTPRPNAEIKGGDGNDVLAGRASVVEPDGNDVTGQFVAGAHEVLKLAQLYGVTEAILKSKSPSCGCGQIYDGTFSGKKITGDGVTTALLKQNGIRVISEEDISIKRS